MMRALALLLLLLPCAARAQVATLIFTDPMSAYGTSGSCGAGIASPWLAQVDGSGTICNFYSSVVGSGGNGALGVRPLGSSLSWIRASIGLTINDNGGGLVGINLYNSAAGNVGTGGSSSAAANGGPYIACATDGASGSGLLTCTAGALDGVSGSFTAIANVSHSFQMDVVVSNTSAGAMKVYLDGTLMLNMIGVTYFGQSAVNDVIVAAGPDGFSNAGAIGAVSVWALGTPPHPSGGGGGGGGGGLVN